MKQSVLTVAFVLIALFSGCATWDTTVVDGYAGKKLQTAELVVAPYSVSIANESTLVSVFGRGNAEAVFKKKLEPVFAGFFWGHARIDRIRFSRDPLPAALRERRLQVDGHQWLRVQMPEDGTVLTVDSLKPEFILFLGDYSVSDSITGTGAYDGKSSSSVCSTRAVILHANYALWDNMEGRVITFGRVTTSSTIEGNAATEENWYECVEDLAQSIVRKSPFYETKKRKYE